MIKQSERHFSEDMRGDHLFFKRQMYIQALGNIPKMRPRICCAVIEYCKLTQGFLNALKSIKCAAC